MERSCTWGGARPLDGTWSWVLQPIIGVSASSGSNYPADGYTSFQAFSMEVLLTLGLVSVILGTVSGALGQMVIA